MEERITNEALRKNRSKGIKALEKLRDEFREMEDNKEDVPLSITILKDRAADLATFSKNIRLTMEMLADSETDSTLQEEDEQIWVEVNRTATNLRKLCSNLITERRVSNLLEQIDEDVEEVEALIAADDRADCTSIMTGIQKQLEEVSTKLTDSTITKGAEIWTTTKSLRKRVVRLRVIKMVEIKPSVVVKSDYETDFKIPKVNIPKFKGGLEAWHAFWSRFKTAVDENPKLTEPVKLAVLIDLVVDPTLSEYLVAANDGGSDRYSQIVKYLKSRFDRPRELHKIYMKKLVDLAPIKPTPAEISLAADTVFAAVSGIRRSGQASIDNIATSLVMSIMPKQLRIEWENKTDEDPMVPHIDQWISFMRKKAITADQTQKTPYPVPASKKQDKGGVKSGGKVYLTQGESVSKGDQAPPSSKNKGIKYIPKKCSLCNEAHFLFQCDQFKAMAVTQRKAHVDSSALCLICLRSGHGTTECTRPFRCRVCSKQHNTMLHQEGAAAIGVATPLAVNHVSHKSENKSYSEVKPMEHKMMMTSMVVVSGPTGERLTVRAMLDSGAEASVLSKKVMNQLNLKPIDWVTVSGIESFAQTPARPKVVFTVSSIKGDWSKSITSVVLPKVTINLPRHNLNMLKELPHLKDIFLADPKFYQSRKVDLILDADIFDEVLLPRKLTGPPGSPSAWNTILGWGVMGRYTLSEKKSVPTAAVNLVEAEDSKDVCLDKGLQRFWLMEELPKGAFGFSPTEAAVQQHYAKTHFYTTAADFT